MKIQRCKGTRDLAPEEMAEFRIIEGHFRDSCQSWGYREVKTPTIEPLHLFTSVGTLTPGMLSKVYSFLDWDGWSGERVVLRPDGTIPIARLFIDRMADSDLARMFYITNIFIFEETGRETREKWQCGAELVGVSSPQTDAELIMLALEVINKLKLEGVKIRLSHAGLIKALLSRLEVSTEEQANIFDQILDGNKKAIDKIKSGNPEIEGILLPLIKRKGQSAGFLKNLKGLFAGDIPEIADQIDDFIRVVEILEALGCDYQIDIASGAGFEYYTGVIFQIYKGREKIGGGGRYDNLIPEMGGGDIPASGFALYLDRLMNIIKADSLALPRAAKISVKPESEEVALLKTAFEITSALREAGYIAEITPAGTKTGDENWSLEITDKGYSLISQGNAELKKLEARNIEEVLKLLEENIAGENSPA